MKCNACGRTIVFENGIMKEDVFEAVKEWGYFSGKDLEIHRFNLCEQCYDGIVSKFVIPVNVKNVEEALSSLKADQSKCKWTETTISKTTSTARIDLGFRATKLMGMAKVGNRLYWTDLWLGGTYVYNNSDRYKFSDSGFRIYDDYVQLNEIGGIDGQGGTYYLLACHD